MTSFPVSERARLRHQSVVLRRRPWLVFNHRHMSIVEWIVYLTFFNKFTFFFSAGDRKKQNAKVQENCVCDSSSIFKRPNTETVGRRMRFSALAILFFFLNSPVCPQLECVYVCVPSIPVCVCVLFPDGSLIDRRDRMYGFSWPSSHFRLFSRPPFLLRLFSCWPPSRCFSPLRLLHQVSSDSFTVSFLPFWRSRRH